MQIEIIVEFKIDLNLSLSKIPFNWDFNTIKDSIIEKAFPIAEYLIFISRE